MAETVSSWSKDLLNWCRGEGIDPQHAFILLGVSEKTEIEDIEETLSTIKAFGRSRVRGKMFNPLLGSLIVLCECRERIKPRVIPPEVMPLMGETTWKIVIAEDDTKSSAGFTEKLSRLLEQEGKTLSDLQALSAPSTSQDTASILRAVGDLIEKTNRPSSENAYRRLRTFSGISPTPAGEENLENWIEQAMTMVEECGCSDREKRKRIIESLKGPALETIRAVRITNPEADAVEYIQALECSFGTAVSGEDLYFDFRLLRQQSGEKLSEFLRRIERALTKVVKRGGLPSSSADKVRVEQLIRGSTDSDLLILHLRLRERKKNPPSFLQLLNEVREEEEYEATRQKLNSAVRRPHVRTVCMEEEGMCESRGLRELREEFKELKSKLSECIPRRPPVPDAAESERVVKQNTTMDLRDKEVSSLKSQVQEL